jgi:integrase
MKTSVNFMVHTKDTINYVVICWSYGYQVKSQLKDKPKYVYLRMPTGITITDSNNLIEDENGSKRVSRKEKDFIKHNTELTNLENKILSYVKNYEYNHQEKPSPLQIKNHLKNGTVTTTVKGQTSLLDLTRKHLKTIIEKNTRKNYNQFITKLELFEKQRGYPVIIEQITKKLYEEFEEFIDTYQINDEGETYNINSASKYKSTFKRMLTIAGIDEIPFNFKMYKEVIKVEKKKVKNVYMDKDKIKKLINLDLSEHPHLIPVRDYFLIGIFTGLRISDMQRLKTELHLHKDKNGDHYIVIEQKKTEVEIRIPIDELIVKILNNYGGTPKMVEQVFNRNVKEVCRLAGFTKKEPVTIHKTTGKTYDSIPFYELVSSHTMRRSFCTNLFLEIPAQVIMKMSGHEKMESFMGYICENDNVLVDRYYDRVKAEIQSFRK